MSRPLAGSRRSTKNRSKKINSGLKKDFFDLVPTKEIKLPRQPRNAPKIKPSLRKLPLLAMPFGQDYSQPPHLPLNAPLVGLSRLVAHPHLQPSNDGAIPSDDKITGGMEDVWGIDLGAAISAQKDIHCVSPSERHRKRRNRQFERWTNDIIPNLVLPYLELRHRTQNGQYEPPKDVFAALQSRPCTCQEAPVTVVVLAARWDRNYALVSIWLILISHCITGFENLPISFCQCKPASLILITLGLFPCAPLRPTMAFDVNLLELVTINSSYIAPNLTGWALTLEWFWRDRGFVLGPRVCWFLSPFYHITNMKSRMLCGGDL